MAEGRGPLRPPALVAVGLALIAGGFAAIVLGEHLQRVRSRDWITFSTGIGPAEHPLSSAGARAIWVGAVVLCAATSCRLLTTSRQGALREALLVAGATAPPGLFVGCLLFAGERQAAALVPAWVANPEVTLICTPALCAWLVALAWRLRRPVISALEASSVTEPRSRGLTWPSTRGAPR